MFILYYTMNSYISNSNLIALCSFLPSPVPYLNLPSPTESSLPPNKRLIYPVSQSYCIYKMVPEFPHPCYTNKKQLQSVQGLFGGGGEWGSLCSFVFSFVVFKLRAYNRSTVFESYIPMVFKTKIVNIYRRIQFS